MPPFVTYGVLLVDVCAAQSTTWAQEPTMPCPHLGRDVSCATAFYTCQ